MEFNTRRSCGNCTTCCDGWLQIEVRGHLIRPGCPCPFRTDFVVRFTNSVRQIHQFVCGWLVGSSPLSDWMRPDMSDMIMLAANFTWRGLPVDVVVPVGERPKKKALDWLMQFCSANHRLLLYRMQGEWFAFGPPARLAVTTGQPDWKGARRSVSVRAEDQHDRALAEGMNVPAGARFVWA